MDARRWRLYEMLKPKLDEEPARELVLALPAQPSELVTKDYLSSQLTTLEARVVDRLTWRMITVMGAWSVMVSSAWAVVLAVLR